MTTKMEARLTTMYSVLAAGEMREMSKNISLDMPNNDL